MIQFLADAADAARIGDVQEGVGVEQHEVGALPHGRGAALACGEKLGGVGRGGAERWPARESAQ